MVTENTTPNRGYQEPAVGNTLEVDVGRLIAALRAIDVDVADALAQIVTKAGLASPAFTGTPTAPTAAPGTDSGQLATTAFVKAALAALVDSAPGALDTLNELAAAIGDDPNFAATMAALIGTKADAAATTAALAGKADAAATAAALAGKVEKGGDTLTGRLNFMAGTTGSAPARIPDGVAPSTPADGDIWRRDAGGGLFLRKGGSSVKIIDGQQTLKVAKAHLTDTKAQNTASQTLTASTWNIRHLNTENYDPDGIVSISSNQFTLAAGSDYSVVATLANANNGSTVTNSYARIYNVTDGAPVQNQVYASNGNGGNVFGAIVLTAVLTGGKTYRIEHNVSGSGLAILGANQTGMSEVYLSLMIERLTNGFA